VIVKYSLFLLL